MTSAVRRGVAVLLLCGLAGRALASPVVLEVHIGGRPLEANQVLQPLLDELERGGLIARPASVHARLGDHLTRSGITDRKLDLGTVIDQVDAGRRLLKKGECAKAAKQFDEIIDRAHENLAMVVNNRAESQKALMDAHEGLAVCLDRLQESKASNLAWEELVRSYPDQELVIRGRYGTAPYLSYQAAQKRLTDRGSGTLIIEVEDRSALIFINEWDHPQTAALQTTVLPGRYRVLVLSPGTAGQWYDVGVGPGERIHLKLNGALDAALTVSDTWNGFVFANQRDAAHVIEYARRLVGPDEQTFVAVSFTQLQGSRGAMAAMYRLDTGARVRRVAVPLNGIDDERRLRALAHVLLQPNASEPEVVVVPEPVRPSLRPRVSSAARPPSSSAKWWLAGGAGVVAATGGALVRYDNVEECSKDPDCRYLHYSASRGYPALGIAALMAIGAGYLFYRDAHRPNVAAHIGLIPSTSGVIAGMTGAF